MTAKTTNNQVDARVSKPSSARAKKATAHMPSHLLAERWFVVDLANKPLGRAATTIAKFLMGKDIPSFNPAVDAKTNVIVINAGQVKLSGNKLTDRVYYKHTGYLGGLKETTPERILAGKDPGDLITRSVYGMLPKNKLRHVMMKRLRVFAADTHPHGGQNPVTISI